MISRSKPPWSVLFFDHTARLGGGERSLIDLVGRLDPGLVRPVVVVGEDGPLAEAVARLGIPVRIVPLDPGLGGASRRRPSSLIARALFPAPLLEAVDAVARILRHDGAALLHTNSQKAHWIGLLAARRAGVPVVWHFRDILDPGPLLWSSRVGARLADATIAISGAVRRSLLVGGRGARIRVVHNGIARVAPGATRVPGPVKVVGMVSQLARWKGPEVLLEAAALARRVRPELEFVLVGEVLFPESEGPYDLVLSDLARRLGLSDAVRFAGGVPDAGEWFGRFDVLVHPPVRPEPFGRVVLEAMAAGLPVIASRGGGVDEIVREGETGLLVEPGDPEALAEAILALAEDPGTSIRMGELGRRRAMLFEIDRTVAGVLDVYRRVLGAPGTPGRR